MADKKVSLEDVNLRLAELGVEEQLVQAKDYLYFSEGESSRWPQAGVYTPRASDLSLDRWIAEYEGLSGRKIRPESGYAVQVTLDAFPRLTDGLSDRHLSRLRRAFDAFNAGLLNGAIPNALLKESTDNLGDAIAYQWDKLYNNGYNNRKERGENPFYDLSLYGIGSVIKTRQAYKKMMKVFLPDDVEWNEGFAFMREMQPLVPVLEQLKALAVKRQVKAPEDRAAPKYEPPRSSGAATAAVRKVMTEVTTKEHDALVKFLVNYSKRYIERFNTLSIEDQQKAYYKDPYLRMAVDAALLVPYKRGGAFAFVDDIDAALLPNALKDAKQIQEDFVSKNVFKISSIVEAKGNMKEIAAISHHVNLTGLTGAFRVSFDDNSSFVVNNSVVYSVSTRGKSFARYPLTFHDVVMPDGQRMKLPSEEKVNVEFAKIDRTGARPEIKEVKTWNGDVGAANQLTRREILLVPTEWLLEMSSARGEAPAWDAEKKNFGSYSKTRWNALLTEVARKGITEHITMIFRKKSLTAAIERDVHEYVRSLHPVQYIGFRLASFLSRVFMVCVFGLILAMGVISAFLSHQLLPDSAEMQQLTQQMSQYI